MLQINATIIPVFYHVNPSDLRYVQNGIYADAFVEQERKRRYDFNKIEEWKEALKRVSYLSGCIVHADKCDEGKLLREIVDTVLHKMKKVPLEVAMFPVGLDEAVEDFESKVASSPGSENIQIVGIVGMGGSGKTTLARELYNRKCSSINRSSFLSNVRDAASKNALQNLQKNLLQDLRVQHSPFHDINEGIGILARHLRSITVLIVLDDVDDVDQMQALLPPKHNLGRGSFIIVTTREVEVLTSSGISSIYPMKLLDPLNAKQLFCRHAFLHPYSQIGFEHVLENYHKDLIERFVEACNGLPLSLKVVGAMVNGKSKACWESQLLKISRILPNKIVQCLKLSYDSLDSEEREMFLDVACFFIGEEKSMVVAIWDGSGWNGELGLEALANKCFVGFDWYGRIQMHDHLRDMGREIARDVSTSRIWREEQINILEERTQIRGMVLGLSWPNSWFTPAPLQHCLEKIIKRPSFGLQLLAARGNYFGEEFEALSRDLVWLRWCDFNGTNIPSWLSLEKLRVLELYNAENLQQLWKDNVEPPLQLRELIINLPEYLEEWWEHNPRPSLQLTELNTDLSGRTCFQGLPRSIGRLRHLKKIVLKGNASGIWMRRLPEEFCNLKSLEFLELSDFPVLSSLPDHFGKLINLRTLNLLRVQLITLPNSLKQLKLLQFLSITKCRSLMFTSDMFGVLEFMTDLQVLNFSYCPNLEELPHLTTQVSLRELDLRYTSLRKLPNSIGHLTKLETFVIGSPNLTSLPESLEKLSRLTYLETDRCDRLETLPEAFRRLPNLRYLVIDTTPVLELGLGMRSPSEINLKNLKSISLLRTQVRRISISDDCCPTLETVMLVDSDELTEIETLPGNVRNIIVERCKKLKIMTGIAGLLNLERLEVYDCPNLEVLPCPAYIHSLGRKITIRGCPKADAQFQGIHSGNQSC